MKLLRFMIDGKTEIGILLRDRGIVSLTRHLENVPTDLPALLANWDIWHSKFQGILDQADAFDFVNYQLDEVRLLPPIGRPGKILGIGLNYADHIAESGMERPAEQLWFMKGVTAVGGPADPIPLPRVSEQLDYEAELVIVIGRPCRYADDESARAAIFGFCVGNDVSIRDWQFRTSQFLLGKSFDGHAIHGPWITTADEVDAGDLDIQARVNGEVRQSSNTHNLIFDAVAQIRYLSQVMTLEPGDLIFTGTPGGVGAGFKPPRWLKAGDQVTVEIAGLGQINNIVVAE